MRIFIAPAALGTLVLSPLLASCSHTNPNPELPRGEAAYGVIPAGTAIPTVYLVRPLDVLSLRVFNEPELTIDDVPVGETGKIQLPLAGEIIAQGRSVTDLAAEIAQRLSGKYIVKPQVSVTVKTLAPRYVSVEGEVNKPGVYEISRTTTLLSAIARAESPTRTAKLDQIIVFRTIGDERFVARFNIKDIRTGLAPDPTIIDGDVVMVGFSSTAGIMENILRAAPLFNAWARFY